MITVKYSATGEAISDFEAETFVEEAISNNELFVNTSSEIVLNYFRIAVKEKKLHHKQITFIIDGAVSKVDKYGTLERYPDNDAFTNSLMRLL